MHEMALAHIFNPINWQMIMGLRGNWHTGTFMFSGARRRHCKCDGDASDSEKGNVQLRTEKDLHGGW